MATPIETQSWFPKLNAPSPYVLASNASKLLAGYESTKNGYAIFTKEIIKSPNDDRDYRLILLPNGMEVLIIHDATADKAAASMDVRVGHLNDPEDLQGLAHFCEHLMFMGTEKYPRENEYSEYLTQNAGASNAFTGMDNTCYYFDTHPTGFEGALDRFAQFFITPLFDNSCTEREANAVNSENSKNLQSDMWRMFQLDKSTSSRDHSFWRFGTGNKQTLWDEPLSRGEDVRGRLIEWMEKHYSANLMKLVVLGKDSLDDMTKMVVDKFSAAPNRNLLPPSFPGNPLGPNELKTAILLKSVKDRRTMEMTFPFPDEGPLYATKPGSFLSHLVGHEGAGSLLSHLKNKGWVNAVSAGAGNGAHGFEFFKVNVDLTAEGLKHHDDVSAAVFAYFDILKSSPPQEWAFNEVNKLSEIAFRFKEKSPATQTAMGMSLQMAKPYPREVLLSAPYLTSMWDQEIVDYATRLLDVTQCRIMIAAKDELDGEKYEMKEKWYGTEYTIVPLSKKLLNSRDANVDYSDMALPKPNSFIPKNLDIKNKVEVTEFAKRPLSLQNSPISRLWYKKDDRWWVPRAGAFFLMRSPLVDDTALNSVKSRFFTELIQDSLTEYSYDAQLAGLSYTFDSQGDGILLTVDGYNDKLAVLSQVVFDKIKNLKVDPKRFAIIKDQLTRAYENFKLEQPYQHAAYAIMQLTQETSWLPEAKLAALANVTAEDIQAHITSLLARMHIETLVHGNVLKDEAVALSKLAESTLAPTALTPIELRSHRALSVSEGKHLFRETVASPENVNSAIEQFTYIGSVADEDARVKLSLLGQMVQEPLFDQLRAKEQLGYIVSSGGRKSIAFMGLRVIVQSERDAAHLETRIDAFWENYKTTLAEMSDEAFQKYKQTVSNAKLEDHKNMWQESSHLWINIHAGYYDFLQRERDAAYVLTITKSDMIEFFHHHFFSTPTHSIRRLSAHLQSQRLQPEIIATLMPAIMQLGIPIDQAQMSAMVASKPTLPQLLTFSEMYLRSNGKTIEETEEYLKKVRALGDLAVPTGTTLIQDREAYRKAQTPCAYSEPIAEYSDLFPSKL